MSEVAAAKDGLTDTSAVVTFKNARSDGGGTVASYEIRYREGDSMTGFASDWDWDLAAQLHPTWQARGLITGALMDVEDLVGAIHEVLSRGASVTIPSITVTPRPPVDEDSTLTIDGGGPPAL